VLRGAAAGDGAQCIPRRDLVWVVLRGAAAGEACDEANCGPGGDPV